MVNGDKPTQRVMTTKEVGAYLKIPISSLWRLTKKGKIRGVKVGKHWRFDIKEVERALKENNSN
jgi:excisionase family DNA binding protein